MCSNTGGGMAIPAGRCPSLLISFHPLHTFCVQDYELIVADLFGLVLERSVARLE